MGINRRKFIQSSSLGLIGILIPFQSFSATLGEIVPPSTLQERLKIAADFRREGRINRAINKFTRITEDYPSDIRGYDGLRKTLLQRKYKELEVLQLYETGFANNPESRDFKQRLAKEYMRLILGNTKFANQYNSSENLLLKAKRFFKELKNEYPNRPEYLELFRKAKRKIEQQADVIDARVNTHIKIHKTQQRLKFKRRFNNKTDAEVESKLNELLALPNTDMRKTHIKELYRIVVKRRKSNQDWGNAYVFALALYNFDKSDSISLKIAKRMANKSDNYNGLVTICQENHILQNTFWSNLGLFDAEFKRYRKTGLGSVAVINQILLNLTDEATSSSAKMTEVRERSVRLNLKLHNLAQAQQELLILGELISGTENPHLAVRYVVLSARYFIKEQNFISGITAIKATLGQEDINDSSSSVLQMVADVIHNVTITNEAHVNRLNTVLNRLYNRQNP
jgi:hypothetical protein